MTMALAKAIPSESYLELLLSSVAASYSGIVERLDLGTRLAHQVEVDVDGTASSSSA